MQLISAISRILELEKILAPNLSETHPEGLNGRLEQWRKALEDNGLRVSREKTKTEYLRCNFSRNENDRNEEEEIRIGEHILEPKESFRYLGSVIHKSGKIDDDVTHRIQVGWVAIRPAMLYGSECWPLTKVQANRMEVAEMRMLRWTCGKTILDMIPNGRRPQSAHVRRVKLLTVNGARRRGRPKLRWEDRLKTDLKELMLSEDMTSDRSEPSLPSRSFLPIGFLALRLFAPLLSLFPMSGGACIFPCKFRQMHVQTDSDTCIAHNYINTEINERQTGRHADKHRIQTADSDMIQTDSRCRFSRFRQQTAADGADSGNSRQTADSSSTSRFRQQIQT
ncbi:hypothetical protein Tco_1089260 [Tanacetum coccineum]